MPIEILMPALSPTMTQGHLVKWLKKEGDHVRPGDVIAEIETDKAIMEVESVDEGILAKIIVEAPTQNVKVNQIIALLLEEGEEQANIIDFTTKAVSPTIPSVIDTTNTDTKIVRSHEVDDVLPPQIYASPLAKKVAALEGIDLKSLKGSGPHGRIIQADVLEAKTNLSSSPSKELLQPKSQPLSQMRRVISQRLTESKQTVPHFYLDVDCNLRNLLALKDQINSSIKPVEGQPHHKISINDIIIKCAAMALKAFPEVNASFGGDVITYNTTVDVAVAVSLEEGLITPIIKNADQKSLSSLSNEVKELARKARSGSLRADEFQGGSFTVTNLGMFGIKNFHAIINLPQSAILATGAAEERVIATKGQIDIAHIMSVSLSCDHRIVDGVLAARFLCKFKEFVENPALMLT
ncbi:pyruvate dehydrogenase complex dihydrolipoamide acetyltransferase [Rickettsiales endosymbiont of Peranema trichophorum]|uniref:pyruvate dehydrogenase complex dihydrolipoamide acetyltransferase n=1 Tax=Rickettsiales endosymbiont of Peranema trichophorum TaxID=2486577 RepID=UPI00102363D2|nr:pyruvate dehydrogenase complex dihydrolipoamide acetyltransferase [Rickettsiales endosymbiont of Peranema trichophorum]RZI46769.1 pyruvate dehydrogenase complex dihydrolipoamide acetyltransferase [Rickettsiales endosymbiont of Peranema trichophorum]